MTGWRQAFMERDGLEVKFMPNGIHITVLNTQKHGHTLLYDDLDEMREWSEKLQECKDTGEK